MPDACNPPVPLQIPKVPGTSVRLSGSTLKLWDAAALLAQRPLLVVHDGELMGEPATWGRPGTTLGMQLGGQARRDGVPARLPRLPLSGCAPKLLRLPCCTPTFARIHCIPTARAVLKHMQLENGQLLLWRIADDATVLTVRTGGLGVLGCFAACLVHLLGLFRLLRLVLPHSQVPSLMKPTLNQHYTKQLTLSETSRPAPTPLMKRSQPNNPNPTRHQPVGCCPHALPQQVPSDPDDPADEAWRWAEHPALEPSVLEPGSLVLRDVPLEAAYGRFVAGYLPACCSISCRFV